VTQSPSFGATTAVPIQKDSQSITIKAVSAKGSFRSDSRSKPRNTLVDQDFVGQKLPSIKYPSLMNSQNQNIH
ncbi:MAG: hypothetical protein ACKO96_45165, partial [Flammeovirgaceae bacterium]